MSERGQGVSGARVTFRTGDRVLGIGVTGRRGRIRLVVAGQVTRGRVTVFHGGRTYRLALGQSITANADPTITAFSAYPGQDVTVSGSGFLANEPVDFYIDASGAPLATGLADGSGNLSTPLQIPDDTAVSLHTLVGVGKRSIDGGIGSLQVYTSWNGFLGATASGATLPGTRFQVDERTMSADAMAGGELVDLNTCNLNDLFAGCTGSFPVVTAIIPCLGSPTLVTATIWLSCNSDFDGSVDPYAGIGSAETGAGFGFSCNWPGFTGGNSLGAPLVEGSLEFVGTENGDLHAVNGGNFSTCAEVTNFPITTGGAIDGSPGGTFLGASGTEYIVFASEDGKVYAACYSGCGTLGSEFSGFPFVTGSSIDTTPLIDSYTGYIIVGAANGSLYVINPSTATAAHTITSSYAIYSSPVEDQGRVYWGNDNGDLNCYEPAPDAACSGWTPPHTSGAIRSTAAVANGVIYVTSRDGHLYAYDENSGAELWAAGLPVASVSGTPFNSSPAIADGVVYVGGTDGDLYAFYTSTGQLVPGFPKATDGFPITSSPAIGQGSVVFTTGDGSVWQLVRNE